VQKAYFGNRFSGRAQRFRLPEPVNDEEPRTRHREFHSLRCHQVYNSQYWLKLILHREASPRTFQRAVEGLHRIVTARQKTGTHASVPIPPDVAAEVIALLNGNPVYVFWTGQGMETSATTNWQHDIRALFKEAGIKAAGNVAKPQITGYLRG